MIKVLENLVSFDNSLSGFKSFFSLCAHRAFLLDSCRMRERDRPGISSSSYKDINSIQLRSYTYDLIELHSSLKVLSPNTVTLEVRASAYKFREEDEDKIQFITTSSKY